MQGGLVMRKLSVCPSVKRVHCDKTEETSVQIKLMHPAARSVCDSWASCILFSAAVQYCKRRYTNVILWLWLWLLKCHILLYGYQLMKFLVHSKPNVPSLLKFVKL